ncbi:MAG: HAMP domain-containing histidine kinase [Gemmataceae bacterium]|nr:HAMP domain-containing histidine kinase [Gemmataceae bacterium]
MRIRWSIRYQLLIPLLTLPLGVVGMSTWAALASADQARRQLETQLRDVVRTVNQATYPLPEKVLRDIKGFSRADYLLLHPGRPPVTTLDAPVANLPPPADGEHGQLLRLDARAVVGGTAYRCAGVRLQHRPNDGAILYIFYPESLWHDALWEAVRPPLILGTFAGAASIFLPVAVGRRLSRRVQELERRTRLIAAGDFSPMPLPGRNDELRDLGRSVNEMAQRLAQYEETVRRTERLRLLGQVSGGLAHQLRNGVTGARLAVQVHARECDGQADGEALAVALRQLVLVEMHLKRFLDLGRSTNLRREPCAPAAAIDETLDLLRPQARHARIELRWRLPEDAGAAGLTVLGDAGQLGHLLLNVVTNALEAAGPGGWVEVRLREGAGEKAVIEVLDSGAGPSQAVAERLFEPFVTGKPEGVGLGLAVARQVAEAHGGTLRWHRDEGPTCFEIVLPVAPARCASAGQRPRPASGLPGSSEEDSA